MYWAAKIFILDLQIRFADVIIRLAVRPNIALVRFFIYVRSGILKFLAISRIGEFL